MTKPTESADALQLGPQVLPELLRDRKVDDAKTIKVLSDPLRLRIIRALTEGILTEPRIWTVKQIAEEIGEQPSKLYWHMKQLLSVDLIQVAEIGLAGGIVEQRYRAAQAGLHIKMQGMADRPGGHENALAMADAAAEEFFRTFRDALAGGRTHLGTAESMTLPPHVRTVGTVMDNRMPQAKAAEFAERLRALITEFSEFETDETGVKVNLLTMFYATE